MLELEAVFYRSLAVLPSEIRSGGEQAACIIGRLLAEEVNRATASIDPAQIGFSMVVSTIMDMPFTSGWLRWESIRTEIARHCVHVPQNFTASYECAGWGYALEYAARRAPQSTYALILVADLNILDISFWRGDANWGASGFGISAVLLRLPPVEERNGVVSVAQSSQGMGEFCVDLRKWFSKTPEGLANVPYLPVEMAGIYTHFLPMDRVMPDLHAKWGHCFGSDTWISYITHLESGLLQPGQVHTATSASLRGYWTMTELQLSPTVRYGFVDETTEALALQDAS